jgi:hypothetical protein
MNEQMPEIRAIFATPDKKRLWAPSIPRFIYCRHGKPQVTSIAPREFQAARFLTRRFPMLKFVILGIASLAFVGTAVAADLPRPQPQPVAAPVGKYPMGKYPVGKSPVGKYPVAAPAPLVTKG